MKYFITESSAEWLRSWIRHYTEVDPYVRATGKENYTVRSVYFDTRHLSFYHQKHDGLGVRRKVRIRSYNNESDDSIAVMEIKRKRATAVIKERVPVPYRC